MFWFSTDFFYSMGNKIYSKKIKKILNIILEYLCDLNYYRWIYYRRYIGYGSHKKQKWVLI